MNRQAKLIVLETAIRTAKRHYEEALNEQHVVSNFGTQNMQVALDYVREMQTEEKMKSLGGSKE